MNVLKLDITDSETLHNYLRTKQSGDTCTMTIIARYVGNDGEEAEFSVEEVEIKGKRVDTTSKVDKGEDIKESPLSVLIE